jgi:hypothetical protein
MFQCRSNQTMGKHSHAKVSDDGLRSDPEQSKSARIGTAGAWEAPPLLSFLTFFFGHKALHHFIQDPVWDPNFPTVTDHWCSAATKLPSPLE